MPSAFSWETLAAYIALILSIGIWMLEGACKIKSLLPKRPRPKVEEVRLRYGSLMESKTPFLCDILVNNIKGDKDCSLKHVEISLNNVKGTTEGYLGYYDENGFSVITSTSLPLTIPIGPSIPACIVGCCSILNASPKNDPLPAFVTITFNTGKSFTKKMNALFDPCIDKYSFVEPRL